MQNPINYEDNYSFSYRKQIADAITESRNLGFIRPSFISDKTTISKDVLAKTTKLVNELSAHLDTILPDHWGNSCQALSTQIFAHLNLSGIPAEIVIGNVIIYGNDEYETDLNLLRSEWNSTQPLAGSQALHAWVTLGDDTVIDAALPPRLAKYYKAPSSFNDTIFIARATQLSSQLLVRHQPILIGSEFFAKTNPPDPMNVLNDLKKMHEQYT